MTSDYVLSSASFKSLYKFIALFVSKMLMQGLDKIKTQFIKQTGADKIFETLPTLGILVFHFPVFS